MLRLKLITVKLSSTRFCANCNHKYIGNINKNQRIEIKFSKNCSKYCTLAGYSELYPSSILSVKYTA